MAEVALRGSSDKTQCVKLVETRARWAPSGNPLHPVVQGRTLRLACAVFEGCEVEGHLFPGLDWVVVNQCCAISFPLAASIGFPCLKRCARLLCQDWGRQIVTLERISQPQATEIPGKCRNTLHSARPDLLEQG
jgi:hypothetical protein